MIKANLPKKHTNKAQTTRTSTTDNLLVLYPFLIHQLLSKGAIQPFYGLSDTSTPVQPKLILEFDKQFKVKEVHSSKKATIPFMRYGWLQHLRSSIMVFIKFGRFVYVPPFARNVKFRSRIAR